MVALRQTESSAGFASGETLGELGEGLIEAIRMYQADDADDRSPAKDRLNSSASARSAARVASGYQAGTEPPHIAGS